MVPPADDHGANLDPGSLLCIELQDVVSVGVATCIVFYIITRIVLITTQIMSSHQGITVVKLRQGSGKVRQGKAR